MNNFKFSRQKEDKMFRRFYFKAMTGFTALDTPLQATLSWLAKINQCEGIVGA